jgi:hypothetical protein
MKQPQYVMNLWLGCRLLWAAQTAMAATADAAVWDIKLPEKCRDSL